MKIRDALGLLQAIQTLQTTDVARQVKFGYMLAYNKRVLETVQAAFQDAVKNEEDDAAIQAFETERVASLRELADKDADGNPIITNGVFQISDQDGAIRTIKENLDQNHPNAEAALTRRTQRIEQLSEEEEEIVLRKIPLADWPDLPREVSPTILDLVMELIEA